MDEEDVGDYDDIFDEDNDEEEADFLGETRRGGETYTNKDRMRDEQNGSGDGRRGQRCERDKAKDKACQKACNALQGRYAKKRCSKKCKECVFSGKENDNFRIG